MSVNSPEEAKAFKTNRYNLAMETGSNPQEQYRGLMLLAEDLIEDDSVNKVLIGVVAADKARRLREDASTLDVAYRAGQRVGHLFRPEAERMFRKNELGDDMRAAFEAEAYRGESNQSGLFYSRDGPDNYALIIYGNGSRYRMKALYFGKFLVEDLGFKRENIFSIEEFMPDNPSQKDVVKAFKNSGKRLLEKVNKFANIIVYYTGMGRNGSFLVVGSRKDHEIPYSQWAKQFARHQGNIVFIQDTSYADTVYPAIAYSGLDDRRVMVVSACGEQEGNCTDSFIDALIEASRRGEPYVPETIEFSVPTSPFSGLFNMAFGIRVDTSPEKHTQTPLKRGAALDYMLMAYPLDNMD